MKQITLGQALEALENMDDYARMSVGVNPHGPYGVLKKFIEQQKANPFKIPTSYKSSNVSIQVGPNTWFEYYLEKQDYKKDALTQVTFQFNGPEKAIEWYKNIVSDIEATQEEDLEKELRSNAVALVEKYYPSTGDIPFTWAVEAVVEALKTAKK